MPKSETRLGIRLSTNERSIIEARAKSLGLSTSEFIRRRCMEDSDRPVINTDVEQLRRIYSCLRHAGGNLNQLAKLANSRRQDLPALSAQIETALASTIEATEEVSRFIAEARASI